MVVGVAVGETTAVPEYFLRFRGGPCFVAVICGVAIAIVVVVVVLVSCAIFSTACSCCLISVPYPPPPPSHTHLFVVQVTFMAESIAAKEALENAVSSVMETKRD